MEAGWPALWNSVTTSFVLCCHWMSLFALGESQNLDSRLTKRNMLGSSTNIYSACQPFRCLPSELLGMIEVRYPSGGAGNDDGVVSDLRGEICQSRQKLLMTGTTCLS